MSQITGDSGSNVLTGTVFRDTIEGFGGDGITSASSHPELVSGDFGTPPRRDASITAMNRSVTYDRRRAIWGTLALVAIAVLLSAIAFKGGTASNDGSRVATVSYDRD